MIKPFALISGGVLLVIGILNFFLTAPINLKLEPGHAAIHVAAGLIPFLLPRRRRQYTFWVGWSGIVLAVIGFSGVKILIPGYIDLPLGYTYLHAALGIVGLFVYLDARGKKTATVSPDNPATEIQAPGR